MADDVKDDRIGSNNTQSKRKTKRIPTRQSARSKSALELRGSPRLHNSETLASTNTATSTKRKRAAKQSQSAGSIFEEKAKNSNSGKDNKSETTENIPEESSTNKSQSRSRRNSQLEVGALESTGSSKVSSKSVEGKKKKNSETAQQKKQKKQHSASDTKLLNSSKLVARRTKSEESSRKRKAKEKPIFSPKRLRSSSKSTTTVQSNTTTAKTGARASRTRSPPAAGDTNNSADNLGSCASSRRHRRTRARPDPPTMENEGNTGSTDQSEVNNEGSPSFNGETQLLGAVAPLIASGASSSSQDGDIGFGLEESDISRLQALLEARGLPAHLFGSLGPRMHLLLHKTFNSGAGTKAQQLITSMQSDNEGTQLQGVMEMCQLLVMGNEETLGGFPVKQVVPVLITLLKIEHNFDIMNHACRALTYLMEALPRSSVVVIDAVPTLLEKLQTIQCMDVAEQSLTALEMLSKRHGKNILQAGGLGACLLFLDFFSIVAQRSALAIAANCCHSVTSEEFHFVKDSILILSSRLTNQDKKSLESVCSAFARIVDNIQKNQTLLESLREHGLLANLKQLLMVTPPIISSNTFVMVVRMLAVMCANCPSIAVELVKLDISETVRYLLIGSNIVPTDIVELVPRSPQELYEITCLICELLPTLPQTGIFTVDTYLGKGSSHSLTLGTWQWRDDRNAWHTYLWVDNRIIEAAYQCGEDEINLSTLGRNYIIDFTTMQQINEDTGTIRSIQRKSGSGQQAPVVSTKSKDESADERTVIFGDQSEFGKNIVQSLIAVVYDVYYSSVGAAIRHKCLAAILKMLYHSPDTLLKDVLSKIPISSYIAGMLSSSDLRITCSALQKADILMSKLTETFHVFFCREGVMHKIKSLSEGQLPSTPSNSPSKNTFLLEEDKHSEAVGCSPMQRNSSCDLPKSSDDAGSTKGSTADVSSVASTSRLAALKSKKRSLKKFGRQRSSKASLNEDSSSIGNSKKLLDGAMRPKSATFSSSSLSGSSGAPSKGSFFSNFAPRWGRSQSYHNTTQSSSADSSNEKSFKEQYLKEQEQNREKVKAWVHKTAQELYQNYFTTESTHPALNILQTLTSSSEELSLDSLNDTAALKNLCVVLLNEDKQAGASPFEIVHSGMVDQLLKYLTWEGGKGQLTRCERIKRFLKIFFGVSEDEFTSRKMTTKTKSPLVALTQKLNLCINQLEQFPVKCQDIPGSTMAGGARGSSALRFFNTHQIKCKLQRHPNCTNVKQWSGGAVKIDPLALVQAIERYLVVRGYGRIREGIDNEMSDDDDRSDDEIEEAWANQLQATSNPKHVLEFTLNGHVLPYNMTVYQAVRQYAHSNIDDENEMDDDSGPFGRASIWSGTHVLLYRPVTQSTENKTSVLKRTKSDFSVKSILRSKGSSIAEVPRSNGFSEFLTDKLQGDLKDPSITVICLIRVLYYLNTSWWRFLDGKSDNNVISKLEFINTKLTAKATRQLQDPLVIMTGNLPSWLTELAKACPFIFPFECRQLLFYTTTFDRDRAVMKLQESVPDLATTDSSDRVTPRLDKKKRTVSRSDLLKQAETVITEFTNSRSLLEIQYEGEVGTGLGPTLEFYALVSKEFQKTEQQMWRGEQVDITEGEGDSQKTAKYYHSRDGLFPEPLPKNAKSVQVTKTKNAFRFLGKFIAKACMDSRIIDIPFSQTFYKCMVDHDRYLDISDLQYVDSTLYKSLTQLNNIVTQKKKLEDDETHSRESLNLALSSLTLDGVSIEDLGLDFLLPGTNIELKKNGKAIAVTIDNLEEYLQLVVQFTLRDGVARQFQAFKEGFEQFCPMSSLQMFYPDEMELLFCGSKNEPWDVKELLECCRCDHGYTTDSRAVQFLFAIMSRYTAEEQRMFLQFITGSPKLPVGGFRSLNPPLTIVRKTVDTNLFPDNYLPSVMTCVNYLKLPDYSSAEIMGNQLRNAYYEGKNAFHLS